MNDDTDKPLNPVGDAALEARITAWVLGEASPFEAAELEEICARDPEARLFERRLRVLHGFISEDRRAGADEAWKLPAEKRAKIEALFEEPVAGKEESMEQPKIVHRAQGGRRALLALAACTVVSVAAWSLFGTIGVGEKSALAMQMEAPQEEIEFVAGGGGGGGSGGGVGLSADAYADRAPASPAVSAPAQQSAAEMDSLAAVGKKAERGQAVDESLAKLADDSLDMNVAPSSIRSKSGASGPPAKESARSDVSLAQRGPMPGKPLTEASAGLPILETAAGAPGAASGAIASDGFANREAIGRELALGQDAKPAEMEADASERFAFSLGTTPANTTYDLQARFRGEAPKQNGYGYLDSAAVGGRLVEPGLAGGGADPFASEGSLMAPSQSRTNADFIGEMAGVTIPGVPADPGADVSDIMTAGNRSGLGAVNRNSIDAILNNSDRPESVASLAESKDSTLQMNGRVGNLRSDLEADVAGANIPAEGLPKANAADDAWFKSNKELPELQEVELKKSADGSYSGLAQKEMIRRQSAVATSDKLRDEGREAYSKGDYKAAVDKYKASLDVLPADAPMVEDRRNYLSQVLGDGTTALAEQYRKVGKYDEARQLANDALTLDSKNSQANTLLNYLDDPIRTNPALTSQHDQNTDEVRRKLYIAEGNYNLGKFDDANKTYEDVLRIDPYNKAARRGMESVAQARSDYYRAAYDQTRAQLLMEADRALEPLAPAAKAQTGQPTDETRAQLLAEVDKAWELSVPPLKPDLLKELKDLINSKGSPARVDELEAKQQNSVDAVVDRSAALLAEAQEAYAKEIYPEAYRKYLDALGALPNDAATKERRDLVQLSLRDTTEALVSMAMKLGDQDLSNKWMEKGREWERAAQEAKQQEIADQKAETLTSAEPFSTFSLHVSDASFKMAKAALDRGEVPAADGIRPEEFYNAFDYGDPAPASGEPVVCAVEQSAHPALPQRNLLRIGVRTGSQGRGGSTPMNLTLLLDSSGSMEREDRNAGLANAVRQLSGLLKEGDTVSVIGFARQPRLLVDRLPGNRAQELNAIFAQTPSEGGTNLEEGLKLGEELALRQFNAAAQNRIVLFTDGAANLGDAKPETLQAKVEQMRQNGIAFDAAGFGTDGLNDKLLERLTRNGNGRYYIVDRAEDADASFAKQLAGAFRPAAENVKVQVRFNPARVAKYKLIGFEEHRLKKEDFRNDAVDAAEMAAEEAGNALYQIEALPQGEGEVGEVSVRFRDTASGQMVERTWTIPYEAQAPAFDQAAPSIQLAGLAAFAAEKLRAAPMADAVDFQQLAPVLAKVKARYSNSKPVAELEAMIGKLK